MRQKYIVLIVALYILLRELIQNQNYFIMTIEKEF